MLARYFMMDTKRQRILTATIQLIDENGLQSTPMSAIAKRAGVAMGTIYHHFPSKEALVAELYQELTDKLGNYVLADYDAKAPVRTRLAQMVKNSIKFILLHPQEFMFWDQYAYSPYIKPLAKVDKSGWMKAMKQIFVDGQAQEILKPIDNEFLTKVVWGIISALVKGHIVGKIVLDEAALETAVSLCWDAIKR
ncbi:MAG: TetR/AcrR family transcriptional regulator [Chloroflexi bacterium]|nr:MAG: TetR/AcrR family transcriptional regulator [Chloroflexota bacterium]